MKPVVLPENILNKMSPDDRKKLGKAGATKAECDAKQLAKSEKEVHKQISQWLTLHDIYFCHSRMDRKTTNQRGQPDYMFAWKFDRAALARPVAIEVKVGSNKLSDEQKDVMMQMETNGWFYFLVDSLPLLFKLLGIPSHGEPYIDNIGM